MDLAWPVGIALGLSIGLNALLILLANSLGTIDRPVARSSHDTPKPTLGGVGIVAGFWGGIVILYWQGGTVLPEAPLIGTLGVATLVMLLFVRDDVGGALGVGQKALIQLLASGVWLYGGFHLQSISVPIFGSITLGYWGLAVSAIVLVATCNVYNFMDGIDGLMAWNTIVVGSVLTYLFYQMGSLWWVVALLLVAATAGFVLLNGPPARIFSGDVGAMFIGFVLAVMALHGEQVGVPLWIFALLLAYFFFDTAYTLVRRALNGENVLQAHRKHLYQRLGNMGWSHQRVVSAAVLLTLVPAVGGVVLLLHHRLVGTILIAIGAVLLVATAVWIESRDRTFG